MAMIPVLLNIGEKCVVPALQEAATQLDSTRGEVVLDFSSVGRINPGTLRAMEEFASVADGKGVKVVLCGVRVDVYKVLKLTKLASRFSFGS